MRLRVELKQAAKKNCRIVTKELDIADSPATVRELIAATAAAVYADFLERKHADAPVMTEQEDRIRFGFFYNEREPAPAEAEATAVQAFCDGLVALFIDGVRWEDPDAPLHLTGAETLAFVKLTMLAGRMW